MTATMNTVGLAGDTKIEWDKDNQAEVDNARASFDRLTRGAFTAMAEFPDGSKKRITSFDPTATKIVFAPGGMVAG